MAANGLTAWLMTVWAQPKPTLAARLLQPLSWLYRALAAADAATYRWGWRPVQRAPVPVLVVGNLIAGGAGKTPTVIAVIDLLRHQGWTPGVVSRGHGRSGHAVVAVMPGRSASDTGDEPLLICLRTGAPVVVGADRAAAAQALCARHPDVDIIVADDGLQHHRLHHDMAVLVFDDRGAGNGLCLPAGPLRQRLPAQVPSHSLVLYNAQAASTALPGFTGQRRLVGVLPLDAWWAGRDVPVDGGWAALQGRSVLAAAGLAQPARFFDMLSAQGLHITPLPLADHHPFTPLPWPAGTAEVIVTEKDAVKLPPQAVGNTRVWVARLDFQPEPAFAEALRRLCAPFKTTP